MADAQASGRRKASVAARDLVQEKWLSGRWSADRTVAELARLGPSAIGALFEIALDDVGTFEPGTGVHPARVERTGELAERALARMREKEVLTILARRVNGSSALEAKLAAMRVLGGMSSNDAFTGFLVLVTSLQPDELRSSTVRKTFEASFGRLIADRARWYEPVDDTLASADDALREAVIAVVVQAEDAGGLKLFPRWVGEGTELNVALLDGIGTLALHHPWSAEGAWAPLVRLLHAKDWRTRKAAAVALGRLHAVDAFEEIAHLLNDPRPAVRHSARWALEAMAGEPRGETSSQWIDWFDAELDRWGEVRDSFEERSVETSAAELVRHMRVLCQYPVFRHETAELLTPLLFERPELSTGVCQALIVLRSGRSVPGLVAALDEMGDTAEKAWEVLVVLTQKDLPPDAAEWKDLVSG